MKVYLSHLLANEITGRAISPDYMMGNTQLAKRKETTFLTGHEQPIQMLESGCADAVLSNFNEAWNLKIAMSVQSYAWFTWQKCSALISHKETAPLFPVSHEVDDIIQRVRKLDLNQNKNSRYELGLITWKEKDMKEVIRGTREWLRAMAKKHVG